MAGFTSNSNQHTINMWFNNLYCPILAASLFLTQYMVINMSEVVIVIKHSETCSSNTNGFSLSL